MGWKTSKYITRYDALAMIISKIQLLSDNQLANLLEEIIDELGEYGGYSYYIKENREWHED